jgi:hypothetical protein
MRRQQPNDFSDADNGQGGHRREGTRFGNPSRAKNANSNCQTCLPGAHLSSSKRPTPISPDWRFER